MHSAKAIFSRQAGLLLLLLAAMVPYLMIAIFWFHQHAAHRLFEEMVSHTKLTRIELSTGEYYWVKKGKEIMVNHRMFDVKQSVTANGKTIFWGLYDDEETALVNNWMKIQGKGAPEKLLVRAAFMFQLIGQSFQTDIKIPPAINDYIAIKWCAIPVPFLYPGHHESPIKPPGIFS